MKRWQFNILFVGLWAVSGCDNGQQLNPAADVRAAPGFAIEDTQGKMHELSDYKGQVLVVNFWATWCAPCVKEMPSLQRAWEALRDEGIQVLAINMGEDKQAIDRFTDRYPVDFPVLLDTGLEVANEWSVMGLPTTYVVNPAGEIAYQITGEREWDAPELLEEIRAVR